MQQLLAVVTKSTFTNGYAGFVNLLFSYLRSNGEKQITSSDGQNPNCKVSQESAWSTANQALVTLRSAPSRACYCVLASPATATTASERLVV